MNIEDFRNFCLSLPFTTESFPFDDKVLVFKIGGKIYALTDVINFDLINVKCEPDKAEDLRARYSFVTPGYHMNKKHWNSLMIDSEITDLQIKEWLKDSYQLVLKSLPKRLQKELIQ